MAKRKSKSVDPNDIDKLCGWVPNPKEVEQFLNKLMHPVFGVAAPHLADTGKGKDVFLWDAEKSITGSVRPPHKQTIGDCVSHGFSGAIDDLRYVRMAWQQQNEEFVETATEVIYAGSRVEVGKGQCGNQDGSVGAWAAEWVLKYGVVPRAKYGNIDLTTYSGERAKQWGAPRAGVPDELEPIAKQYPVRTCSLITGGYAEARDAIGGGKYPVACCSNQGFTLTRTKDGFCTPKGSWGHCIYFRGVSDNPKRPGLVYQQSWGPDMPDGPLHVTLPHGLEMDLPPGAFFIDADVAERMLKQNDSYVISDMVGYPARDFDFHVY